jgi:hypothetical protein
MLGGVDPMYNSKNIQYTSNHITNIGRKILIFAFFLVTILLSGCTNKKNSKDIINDNHSFPTTTQIASTTPTFTPTPTIKPSASITIGEEISIADAQTILEEHLDTSIYSVELLSETVDIDTQQYISFIASEDATPLEPILIVNKYNGKVSCMSKSGKLIAFNNFPSNSHDDIVTYDWNGTYFMRDDYERIISTLQMVQNDSSSFEFIIQSKDNVTSYLLAGIGHISEDSAIFTDENDSELVFMMEEDKVILYDKQAFSNNGLSIEGTYEFESSEEVESLRITPTMALELVSELSMLETKLPVEISEYTLKSSKNTVIVQNRICYEIGAYAKLEAHNILMTTFYVSIDGNVAFAYDDIAKNTYATIELY